MTRAAAILEVAVRFAARSHSGGHLSSRKSRGNLSPLPHAPLVSVCLAILNERETIAACLDSIVTQNYDPVEIVVADGGSTDGTLEIVREFAERYPRVRSIENPRVRSDFGFNLAVQNARGDLIMLLGGHARLLPEYLAKAVHILQAGEAEVVGGPLETRAPGYMGQAIAMVLSSPFGTFSRFRYARTRQLVDTVAFGVYRAELFDKFGPLDVGIPKLEDLELNRRITRAGYRILLDPEIRAVYYARRTIVQYLRKAFQTGHFVCRHFFRDPRVLGMRHLVPGATALGILVLGVGGIFLDQLWVVLSILTAMYLLLAVAATAHLTLPSSPRLFPAVLGLFPIHHLTYGVGTVVTLPYALWLRLTHRQPVARRHTPTPWSDGADTPPRQSR